MKDIKPGIVEIYFGPMNSAKSKALIDRVATLIYLRERNLRQGNGSPYEFLFFKPDVDQRDGPYIKSEGTEKVMPCTFVPTQEPSSLIDILEKEERESGIVYPVIGIDECQFFPEGIADVVAYLQMKRKNVLVAGLSLDFRGELFGPMGKLIAMANEVHPLTAACQYPGCNAEATRTQRLIDGKPAPYDAPIVSIEGSKQIEAYQARCLEHHFVPGKPYRLGQRII